MEEEKKVEELEQEYALVEVPTGSALAIKSPDGRSLSIEYALVELLNKVNKIEKQVS